MKRRWLYSNLTSDHGPFAELCVKHNLCYTMRDVLFVCHTFWSLQDDRIYPWSLFFKIQPPKSRIVTWNFYSLLFYQSKFNVSKMFCRTITTIHVWNVKMKEQIKMENVLRWMKLTLLIQQLAIVYSAAQNSKFTVKVKPTSRFFK